MKLKDLNNLIKEVFEDTLVTSVNSVYELSDDKDFYKLVISLHGVDSEESIIIHTKFIFKTNIEKTETINDSFYYLYDINCVYRNVNFSDIEDLKEKLLNIIYSSKFGNDIRTLSYFLSNPITELNTELSRKNIEEFSVFEVKYNPKYKIVPCSDISFNFDININNIYTFKIEIKKLKNEEYKISSELNEWFEEGKFETLENMTDVICFQIIKIMKKLV